MKKVLMILVTAALVGLSLQASAGEVTAEDINLAMKLNEQRETCYKALDKAPNDDHEVPESELADCMIQGLGNVPASNELVQAQADLMRAMQRFYAGRLAQHIHGYDQTQRDLTVELLTATSVLLQIGAAYGVDSLSPELVALKQHAYELEQGHAEQIKHIQREIQ